MPGLSLALAQAQRLSVPEGSTCEALLDALAAEEFLTDAAGRIATDHDVCLI